MVYKFLHCGFWTLQRVDCYRLFKVFLLGSCELAAKLFLCSQRFQDGKWSFTARLHWWVSGGMGFVTFLPVTWWWNSSDVKITERSRGRPVSSGKLATVKHCTSLFWYGLISISVLPEVISKWERKTCKVVTLIFVQWKTKLVLKKVVLC
jgi:hypothetical protein